MTTTIPRWCVNCKHSGPPRGEFVFTYCKHPIANQEYAHHLADGDYRLASSARSDETTCGIAGRLFEPKVTADDSMRPRSGSELLPRRNFFNRFQNWTWKGR